MAALAKAVLLVDGTAPIGLMINPESFRVSRSATWGGHESSTPSGGGDSKKSTPSEQFAGPLTYQGTGPATLSFDLILDSSVAGTPSVQKAAQSLLHLVDADDKDKPPLVKLMWGSFTSFESVVTDVTLDYQRFVADGSVSRAKASLTLKQFKEDKSWGRQNPTSGTPNPGRTHILAEGESLSSVAAQTYGDPAKWRLIAEANGIDDPLAVRPGAVLRVPGGKLVRRA